MTPVFPDRNNRNNLPLVQPGVDKKNKDISISLTNGRRRSIIRTHLCEQIDRVSSRIDDFTRCSQHYVIKYVAGNIDRFASGGKLSLTRVRDDEGTSITRVERV